MIRPARVVPSNAPPLADNDNGHSSRVVQEHSGNRQHHDYSYTSTSDQKCPPSLLTENLNTGHQIPQPQHFYRQTPLQRHHYRYGHGRTIMGGDDRARVVKASLVLYHRFRNSEHYMKYRGRQHKDGKNNQGEQKWPDRLEMAFFEALVRWPPMGRRQLLHKDKLRGRNELIADYIEETTGEIRNRKQVSSHIQVLKPFVEGDSFIMRMLSKEDLAGHGGQSYRGGGKMASQYTDTRRMSSHHTIAHHAPSGPATVPIDSHTIQKSKALLEVFEPIEFQMFVQQKFTDDTVHRLHTYSQSISDPRQEDKQLPDWQSLQAFPLLASIHNVRPLDCNVLLAEASLAFPTRSFKGEDGKSLPGVELGISFLCNSRHLPIDAHVVCSTNFYHNMKHLKDHSGRAPVQLTESSDRESVETQLKFGSNFWAKTLATLAGSLGTSASPARDPRQEVKEYIDGITAAQEVAVRTDTGYERLLVIYWKFRLSKAERGRAYWSRLLLPQRSSTSSSSSVPNQYPDPQIQHHQTKADRNDSVYDYTLTYTDPIPYASASFSHPTLQSPFEYDSTSGSGSALTSATWPTMDEAPQSAVDDGTFESSFDLEGNGKIDLSYDPTMDFSHFDSAVFDFGGSHPVGTAVAAGFGTDPALGEFGEGSRVVAAAAGQEFEQTQFQLQSQSEGEYSLPQRVQEFSQPPTTTAAEDYSQSKSESQLEFSQDFTTQQPWSFESQLSAGAGDFSGTREYPTESRDLAGNVFDPYSTQYDHAYHVSVGGSEGQAYGGAGQDAAAVVVKEEGSLGAVAGARYLVRAQHYM